LVIEALPAKVVTIPPELIFRIGNVYVADFYNDAIRKLPVPSTLPVWP
jgi:hypothetical protein